EFFRRSHTYPPGGHRRPRPTGPQRRARSAGERDLAELVVRRRLAGVCFFAAQPQEIYCARALAWMVGLSHRRKTAVKPKLLVVELWGMGDLVIATPFLKAASEKYAITLLAKPYAKDLQQRFWPAVEVVPFIAPWTAFQHKYRLFAWRWGEMF